MIHAVQCQREFYLETIDDYWQYPAFEKADGMLRLLHISELISGFILTTIHDYRHARRTQ